LKIDKNNDENKVASQKDIKNENLFITESDDEKIKRLKIHIN
jgi:hypothetical protein